MRQELSAIHPFQDAVGDCQVLLVILVGSRVGRNQRVKECSPRFRSVFWGLFGSASFIACQKKKSGDSHLFRVTVSQCEEL